MKKSWRWIFFTSVAVVALSLIAQNVVCTQSAFAKKDDDKEAIKGKSEEDHGKDDGKGKEAPSAPELPGILMILSAAGAVGGGYLVRRHFKKD